MLLNLNDFEGARREADRALELSPNFSLAIETILSSYWLHELKDDDFSVEEKKEIYDEVVSLALKSIDQSENDPEIWALLGAIYGRYGARDHPLHCNGNLRVLRFQEAWLPDRL